MSTLAEIEAAVEMLPPNQKQELLAFLSKELKHALPPSAKQRRGLKAAERPALEGLPADLSIGTKQRVRALLAQRHATHR